jgi:hypothetical protein
MPTKVNAIVELLARHEGSVLDRLRSKYPEYRDVLTVGTTLGADQSAGAAALYVDLAIDGLQAAKRRLDPNLRRLRERLQRAKRVRLMGQVIGALTSAGLIAAILGGWEKSLAVTTAVVNFAAVLCTVFAGYLETPLHGGSGNLIESFETLVEAAVEAEEVIQSLQIIRREARDDPDLSTQIARANAIAAKLRLGERMLWGT